MGQLDRTGLALWAAWLGPSSLVSLPIVSDLVKEEVAIGCVLTASLDGCESILAVNFVFIKLYVRIDAS